MHVSKIFQSLRNFIQHRISFITASTRLVLIPIFKVHFSKNSIISFAFSFSRNIQGIFLKIFWILRPLFWAKWFKLRSSVKPSFCGLHFSGCFSYFKKVIANNSSKCASTFLNQLSTTLFWLSLASCFIFLTYDLF